MGEFFRWPCPNCGSKHTYFSAGAGEDGMWVCLDCHIEFECWDVLGYELTELGKVALGNSVCYN